MIEMGTAVGTNPYMAPELFDENNVYDEKVDVYALAVILFEMLEGSLPDVKA